MSWLFEPMKDVAVNDSVGEVTSNLRSGGFRMGKPSRGNTATPRYTRKF